MQSDSHSLSLFFSLCISWLNSNFFLPFVLSAPTSDNQYSGALQDRISQKPTSASGKTTLYLRYYTILSTDRPNQTTKLSVEPSGALLKGLSLFYSYSFESATTYVIRVTVFYKQDSILAIDSQLKTWKDYDIDQVSIV